MHIHIHEAGYASRHFSLLGRVKQEYSPGNMSRPSQENRLACNPAYASINSRTLLSVQVPMQFIAQHSALPPLIENGSTNLFCGKRRQSRALH
jgi:hypothetical protein